VTSEHLENSTTESRSQKLHAVPSPEDVRAVLESLGGRAPYFDLYKAMQRRWPDAFPKWINAAPVAVAACEAEVIGSDDDGETYALPHLLEPKEGDGTGWPKPEPLGVSERFGFPADALPEWLGHYVAAVSESSQTPTDLAGMAALSALSTALARKVRVQVTPDWSEPVTLWTMTVAAPGERKSQVQSLIFEPVHAYELALREASEPEIRRAKAEKQVAEKRATKLENDAAKSGTPEETAAAVEARAYAESLQVPERPKLVTSDATPEAVEMLLAAQGGRIAVISPEGGILETIGGRYSKGVANLDSILKGHTGEPITVDRVGRQAYIERPSVTFGLSVQPDVLSSAGERGEFRGRGFLARFLYAVPPSRVGFRSVEAAPIPPALRAAYTARMGALLGLAVPEDGVALTLAPEALQEVRSFMEQIEVRLRLENDLGGLRDWSGKLTGALVRIAGLIHLAAAADPVAALEAPISGDTMRRAISMADYLIAHAQAALGMAREDSGAAALAERFLAHVRNHAIEFLSVRDAYRALKVRKREFEKALDLLEERGWVRVSGDERKPGKPGRPASAVVIVNPVVFLDDRRAA